MIGTAIVPGQAFADPPSVQKDKSLNQFRAKSNGKLKVIYQKSGTPEFVSGVLSDRQAGSNAETAVAFLERNRDFFRMKNPESDLKVKGTEKDVLGMTHVRFQQMKNHVPVDGTEVLVHFDAGNVVRTVNGSFDSKIDKMTFDTTADISKESALATAKEAVAAPEVLSYKPTVELVVYPFKEDYYLTYKVNVNFLGQSPGNWFVYVDAKTGKVVDKYNALMDAGQLKPARGSGIGVKGNHRILNISHKNVPGDHTGSTFYLHDISLPAMDGILTYDFKNQWRSDTIPLPGELFTDKDAAWKDDYQRAAVDAHYNSKMVYDYYLKEHGRNSIDGKGMAIKSTVHYGQDYNNAFWNGYQMTYGDGDGKFFIPLSAGLDVAAHEMTHGVTTHSAGLLYRFESGALNEAYSDIFGALIDADDWEVGEDIMAPDAITSGRTSLRSLENPNKYKVNEAYWQYGDGSGTYPSHMSQFYHLPITLDNGGVHVNSSIINHAAYLTGKQIGKEKLGKIYYRTLTMYLTPDSNFKDARIATIQAATDLYGTDSAEVQAVAAAFDQVGITE
nr:M4 family metallopeptidase [Paenactinomyces guangxiensis]